MKKFECSKNLYCPFTGKLLFMKGRTYIPYDPYTFGNDRLIPETDTGLRYYNIAGRFPFKKYFEEVSIPREIELLKGGGQLWDRKVTIWGEGKDFGLSIREKHDKGHEYYIVGCAITLNRENLTKLRDYITEVLSS